MSNFPCSLSLYTYLYIQIYGYVYTYVHRTHVHNLFLNHLRVSYVNHGLVYLQCIFPKNKNILLHKLGSYQLQ